MIYLLNVCYVLSYTSPPPLPKAMPPQAPPRAPGPTAAALAHCGAGGPPHQAMRTAPGPADGPGPLSSNRGESELLFFFVVALICFQSLGCFLFAPFFLFEATSFHNGPRTFVAPSRDHLGCFYTVVVIILNL